jgi:hypothetical protein
MQPPMKIMYSLRLEPEQARMLKAIKARDGIPESEQIEIGRSFPLSFGI